MCPRCLSKMIDGDMCLKCGTVLFHEGFIPYQKVYEYKPIPEKKERKTGIVKPCRCCGRTRRIHTDGLCNTCASRINGHYGPYLAKGTPEREAALDRFKRQKWPEKFKAVA